MDISKTLRRTIFRLGLVEGSVLRPFWLALGVTLAYIALLSTYIYVSGHVAAVVASSKEGLARIEQIKGLLYVLVTGGGLFVAVYLVAEKIRRSDDTIIRQNRALVASERMVMAGIFCASVGHDMNNLLTIVLGKTELLRDAEAPGTGKRESLDRVWTASEKLRELVQRMMAAGKEHAPGSKARGDLSRLVFDTVEFARAHSHIRTCQVTSDLQPPLLLDMNGALVSRAVMNLVLNAAEATGGQGAIDVRLRHDGAFATLEVHDDGPGIPDEMKQKILEPFFTTKETGNGLGLLSLKLCAEQHGATIRIERSPLGGACFALDIPYAEGAVSPAGIR